MVLKIAKQLPPLWHEPRQIFLNLEPVLDDFIMFYTTGTLILITKPFITLIFITKPFVSVPQWGIT